MSASGDEKKSIDIKKALQDIQTKKAMSNVTGAEQVGQPKRADITITTSNINIERIQRQKEQATKNIALAATALSTIDKNIDLLRTGPSKFTVTDSVTGEKRQAVGRDIDDLKAMKADILKNVLATDAFLAQAPNVIKFYENKKEYAATGRDGSTYNVTFLATSGEEQKESFDNREDAQTFADALNRASEDKAKTRATERAFIGLTLAEIYSLPKSVKKRVGFQSDFLTDLVSADIPDKKKAEKIISDLKPKITGSISTTKDSGTRLLENVDMNLDSLEKLSDFGTSIGLKELTGPDKDENINKVKARLSYATLNTAKSFVLTVPIVALGTVAGPLVGGVVVAAGVASVLNPQNRRLLDQQIRDHPQEFITSLGGALLAGVAVSKLDNAFKTHTQNMKIKDRRILEDKWNKIIDDYSYLEQNKGAEFPSRVLELPEGGLVISDPVNPDAWKADFIYRLPPGEAANFIKNSDLKMSLFLVDDMPEMSYHMNPQDTLYVTDLVKEYPGLKQPWLLDPSITNRADLVARAASSSSTNSLLSVALGLVSKQGYITRDQLDNLISLNQAQINVLREKQIPVTGSFERVSDLTFVELSEIVKNISIQKIDQTQKQVSVIEPVLEITPILEPVPVLDPIPDPSKTPPFTPIIPFVLKSDKRRAINLQLYQGHKQKYRVQLKYSDSTKTSVTFDARSHPEAIAKAEMMKRNGKKLIETVSERTQ